MRGGSSFALALGLGLGLAIGGVGCGPPGHGHTVALDTPEGEQDGADAGVEPPPAGMRRDPTRRERASLDRVVRVTEEIRELTFRDRVPMRVEDRATISAGVAGDIDDDDLAKARVLYVALGLLAPDLDIRALIVRLLGEQVVGYYDPETGIFAVRDDVMRELGRRTVAAGLDEAWIVLVHELVHALQDQRLGLGEVYETERDTDADNAFHALVEGDATLAMIGYVARATNTPLETFTQDASLLRRIVGSTGPLPGDELGRAPAIVRVPLVAAYLDGMIFAAALHGAGGWRAVDAAHRAPPVSTEQTMHPEKYLAGELPDAVALPAIAALDTRGMTVARETTLGELEMGVYFASAMAEPVAHRAAAGWGGDRVRVYRDAAGATSVVWLTTWDDEREATEAAAAARQVMSAASARAGTVGAVEQRGRVVLVLRDVPAGAETAVRDAVLATVGSLPAAPPHGSPPVLDARP